MAEAAPAASDAENQPANAAAGAEPASTADKAAAGGDAAGGDAVGPPRKKATKVPQQKYNNVKVSAFEGSISCSIGPFQSFWL